MQENLENKNLPIGYWIRLVDQLLNEGIDRIHAAYNLTRSQWQILNTIFEQSAIEEVELLAIMKPFMDSSKVKEIINQFKAKGLIINTGNLISLSDKGKIQHANCFERQKEFRQQAMKDIPREDCQHTVQTLQRIVDNLS